MASNADKQRRLLDDLAKSVASLHNGKYTDFSIICSDGQIIRAHRAIVCGRSKVLAAALDGNFKESVTQEITLPDDDPHIIANMINFLYKHDYDDAGPLQTSPDPSSALVEWTPAQETSRSGDGELYGTYMDGGRVQTPPEPAVTGASRETMLRSILINAKVYVAADKYDIPALKEHAMSKYLGRSTACWDMTAFTESARLIFENTAEKDQPLREALVWQAYLWLDDLLEHEPFLRLMKECGDFALAVLILTRKRVTERTDPSNSRRSKKGKTPKDHGG